MKFNGGIGLKMKYGTRNFTIIAALTLAAMLIAMSAQGQYPDSVPPPASAAGSVPSPPSDQASPPAAPPITIFPSSPAAGFPSPTAPSATTPGAPSTGTPPTTTTTPNTAATPAPNTTEVVTWSTKAIADEIALTARDVEAKKKRKKGATLSAAKIAELRAKIARNENDMKSRLKLADHFENEAQPEKMVEVLRPVAADLPRNGLLSIARAYRMLKDYKEEIRVLEVLRAQRKKDYYVHYCLGVAYSSFGNRSSAIDRLEEARKLNPRYYPTYEALLKETKRDGRWNDAISIALDTVSRFGEKGKYLGELCLLYAYSGYLEKAEEVCKEALGKDSKTPRNHVVLALVRKEKDGIDVSEKILKKAASQFPQSELAQWAAAELYWEKNNQFAALKHYRAAVKADANSARAQIGLARSAFEERQYDEALTAFVNACTLNRSHVQELRKSASALRRAKNSEWYPKYDSSIGKCGVP